MLKCNGCGYELTDLVKGPGAVRCPECGGETEHVGGEGVPKVKTVWEWADELGPAWWLALLAPSACVVLTFVCFYVQARLRLDRGPEGVELVARWALVTIVVWIVSILWVMTAIGRRGATNTDRGVVGASVAMLAALCAFVVYVLGAMMFFK